MVQKYLYILTLFFISGCGIKSSSDYLMEANEAGNDGKYQEAITLLDKALIKDPKFKEAYLNRGICNERLNRLDSAVTDYNKLLKLDPKNTAAFYYIGLCKYNQNKFAEAIVAFNKALKTKGFNADDTAKSQGVIDINKNGIASNTDKAKFDIDGNEIFYQRGLAYYQIGKIDQAYSDFMNCRGDSSFIGVSHYMVGLCYLSSNQKVNACDEFKQAEIYGDTTARKMILKNCK